MKTQVVENTYKDKKMFCVHDVEKFENGKPKENAYPVVSFGIKKAKVILNHIEELKQFVKDNG